MRPSILLSTSVVILICSHRSMAQDPTTITRLSFGSCIRQDQDVPIFELINERTPDIFLFVGDNIYADTQSEEIMRQKYAALKSMEGFQQLGEQSLVLATWDDHDFGVNDGGANYPMREASEQIFEDFWALPDDSPSRSRPGIYQAYRFGPEGRCVQIILLDTRFFRGPLKTGERRVGGPYIPTDDDSIPMLGETQWQWLEEQFELPAELRLVASSIQFVAEDAGQETWSNLPHERQRLISLIQDNDVNGVIFLSGDRHWSELSRLSDGLRYPIYDLTSSSLNQIHARGTPTDNQFRFHETTFHRPNFGEINIDWEDRQLTLAIVELEGEAVLQQVISLDEIGSR